MTDPAPPSASLPDAFRAFLERTGATLELVHHGRSMAPTIPDGSHVRIHRVDPKDVAVGDVACLNTERGIVTHRVVHRTVGPRQPYVITRGDARRLPDRPRPLSVILGIVREVQTDTGWHPVTHVVRPPDRAGTLVLAAQRALVDRSPRAAILFHTIVDGLAHARRRVSRAIR